MRRTRSSSRPSGSSPISATSSPRRRRPRSTARSPRSRRPSRGPMAGRSTRRSRSSPRCCSGSGRRPTSRQGPPTAPQLARVTGPHPSRRRRRGFVRGGGRGRDDRGRVQGGLTSTRYPSGTPMSPSSGVRMFVVNEVTTAPKAAPMTTATARSTTLPFMMKSRNPETIGDEPRASAAGRRSAEYRRACRPGASLDSCRCPSDSRPGTSTR